ncbi:killer cell lectin-like receptor subfamily F member 1 isoform X1 [Manis pentadactyla]|uniref:killer cell lectin-like receptor subfamily F member 1 isoform X1 n=1 Tax=Manis pentadactyla TaxID=143292 RepID=UPI00255CF84C|nr:killer cell lectin-like receptor subfamily F member 1 isoform X1 [Manis pentadactyla]KAI5164909.1 Killer Cell Lectin-Like Receptor Subfamily F Member 1 [Manis pentadactyla]
MQDEERYMTLNVELRKRISIQTTQLKLKDCSVMLHRYKILLGISGTVNSILVLTLISLTLLVSQGVLLKCQKGNDSNITQHDDIGNLKMSSDTRRNISNKDAGHCVSRATNHAGFCPSDWIKHKRKCYWFSEEMKSWSDSYGYCLGRNSHLLILQDQFEMAFIQRNLKQSNYVWIGLNFTSLKKTWTWVDGSPLDSKIFFIKGPAKENSCASTKENKIYSEACSSVFRWICQY